MAEAGGEEAYTGTRPVEERHRIDEAALAHWLAANVAGFAGPMSVAQFKGGQSNPTYRLDTPGAAYVLRRKPFGKLLPSAHAVDREFRAISALFAQGFPVPKPFALCGDESVIGAQFYVMGLAQGRVFWNGQLPDRTPAQRGTIYRSLVETLARLHSYDPATIGLADYGKAGNYFARQIDRWSKQYRASETQSFPDMDKLIDWLPRTVPDQARVTIVHGDYRIDNLAIEPEANRVTAVLDWELSTLGDPMADFTYLLMNWMLPADGRSALAGLDFAALGIPTLEQAAAIYANATGQSVPKLDWYCAYNLFRLAAILQGIAGRVRDGTAASARAHESIVRIPMLAQAGWDFARKAGAPA